MAIETILVVEDEMLLLDLVTAELEDEGLRVLQAATAEQALGILRSAAAVDLLFTDIRLPGTVDGWQIGEIARALRPDIKIIYATGYTSEPPRLAPGSLFFTKTYRPSAIVAAMRSL